MKTNNSVSLLFVCSASLALLFSTQLSAQSVLTNVSLYRADSSGAFIGSYFWDQIGGNGVNNVYVFTGSPASPVWLNGANTDTSLKPNYVFSTPGEHVLYFIASSSAQTGYLGVNLWFDDDRTNNRITAVTAYDSGTFSGVNASVTTYNYGNGVSIPSSGSLAYATASYVVTLTGFSATNTSDQVSGTSIGLDSYSDILATATFTVTAVPEPAHFVAIFGVCSLGLVVYRRHRRKKAA